MKKCSRCQEMKPNSEFSFQNKSLGKLMSACKNCMNFQQREFRRLHPEEVHKIDKESYQRNREARVAYARKYRSKNPNKTKNTNLKMKYGITIEIYDEMLKSQDYKCAICKKPQSKHSRAFAVDHNHKTGKVRALLCDGCNYGVGF